MTTNEIRTVATAFSLLGAFCIVLALITWSQVIAAAGVVFTLPAAVVLWLVWMRERGPRV